jgi:hypothetical protein
VWECVSCQSLNTFSVNYLPNFITSLDLTLHLNEIWRFFAVCRHANFTRHIATKSLLPEDNRNVELTEAYRLLPSNPSTYF